MENYEQNSQINYASTIAQMESKRTLKEEKKNGKSLLIIKTFKNS